MSDYREQREAISAALRPHAAALGMTHKMARAQGGRHVIEFTANAGVLITVSALMFELADPDMAARETARLAQRDLASQIVANMRDEFARREQRVQQAIARQILNTTAIPAHEAPGLHVIVNALAAGTLDVTL